MQTVRGIYKDGRVELLNTPNIHVDQASVLITFLTDEPENGVDLRAHGISLENAADLRHRLECCADDWDRPEMDAYDEL
jgi:hypothetical protein